MLLDLEILDQQAINEKIRNVELVLENKTVIVAFSGGVDSSVVALFCSWYAKRTHLIMQIGSSVGLGEKEIAAKQANQLQLGLEFIDYDEVDLSAEYAKNPANRCYFCKIILHDFLETSRKQMGYDLVANGTNFSDLSGHRPGMKAVKEANSISPLADSGLTKQEIRWIARKNNLITWDKPATACLASRFMTGIPITKKGLRRIQLAEFNIQEKFKFSMLRVRDHGNDLARVEVSKDDLQRLFQHKVASQITSILIKEGFTSINFDYKGYRPNVPTI